MSITKRTVYEHIEALRKREYSSQELTGAYLSEIEKKDQSVGAFLFCDAHLSLEAAKEADKRLKEGDAPSLCGIPFAVKDNICTKSIRTTAASKILENFVPPYDAAVIEKLKGEGSVILGKTNMDEFAMGATTETSAYKLTKNPVNPLLTPGGSSGGSCAAVSAGMVPFALGSDTGGSIRQPAAFCGCTGLCPTYGAVSRWGLIAFASSLDRIGPVTKNCRDNALVFSAISGKDLRDATSVDSPFSLDTVTKDVRGLKIGIAKEFFSEGVSQGVKEAVLNATEIFKSLGASLVPISLPSFRYATAAYYIISSAEASSNLARYDGVRFASRLGEDHESLDSLYRQTRSEGFGKEVKRRIMLGTFVLSEGYFDNYYKKACQVRELVKAEYDTAFEKCHIILSPATPHTPYPIGSKKDDPVRLYMEDFLSVPSSLAGLPSLCLPCAKDENGLPVGMQLTGKRFSEDLLYSAGIAFEEVTK